MRKSIVKMGQKALKVVDRIGEAAGADPIERGQVEMRLMNRIFGPVHWVLTGVRKPGVWIYNTTVAAQKWLDEVQDEILGEGPFLDD